MNERELRIGNHVRIPFRDQIVEVESINSSGINLDGGDSCGVYADHVYTEIEGIPLTEEWLLKFELKRIEKQSGWTMFELCYSGGGESVYWAKFLGNTKKLESIDLQVNCHSTGESLHWLDGWLDDVIYVHQLQNLYFALTGEELKLKS